MALSRSEQRRILREDRERRIARDVAEHLALTGSSDAEPAQDVLPNNHRDVRVSPRYKGWPTRVVGIAPGTESTSDGTPTVLCRYADGTSEIRTVASFRKGSRNVRPTETAQPRQNDIQRYEHIIGTNADVD